jgi:signal transduction histidine kinase
VTHPDDLQKTEEVIAGLLSETIGAATFEKRLRCKDGRTAWALVSKSLLKEPSGAPLYFITHIQDISAQKAAQRESASLEAQLRHAQKMEAIGTLSAGIAHDFNNILAAIMGYTELALLDTPPETENLDRLEKVMQACSRAAGLIKQILAFSRQDEETMEPVQLSSVVKEALKLLRSTLPPHIAIVQEISNAPYVVQADPTQVHQLVMNLCTNAYHAMMNRDSGTLTVTLQPEAAAGTDGEAAGANLKLTIADTGCGMAPEVLERIFEPYFTTKKKGLGTGLGLSIVHGIVKKHGGRIQVRSAPGEGTRFEIRLPASEQTGSFQTAAAQVMASGKERILVVDDEKEITAIYQEVLTRQGYCVEARNDPNEALDEFRQNPDHYQLVLTDLAMPGMSGEKLALEIERIRPQVPVVLCTGYFQELQKKNLSPAIRECLTKPVNLGVLMETVRRAIDRPAPGA